MDNIIKAITSAVAGNRLENPAVANAYSKLKSLLRQKYGSDSDLVDAVERLEKKPDSPGRRAFLEEEFAANQVNLDPDIRKAAQKLLDALFPKPAAQKSTTQSPLQRPARPEHFTGRNAELEQLAEIVQPGHIVNLCGPAGVGKSALAAELVWKMTVRNQPPEMFPDGVVYHSFYTQPRTDIAVEEIARIFHEEPIPSPYEALNRALSNRRVLLVLDGAELADDLPGILAACNECGVLVTSRTCVDSITDQFPVGPLPAEAASQMFKAWAGWQTDDVTARIAGLLGGLPLAIRLAGQFVSAQKINAADYLAWLETTPLPQMSTEERPQNVLPLVLDYSLGQVSETARQALAVAGLLTLAPFDPEAVYKTLAIQPGHGLVSAIRGLFQQKQPRQVPQVRLALRELSKYGLLWWFGERFEISHPFIYTYAKQNLTPPPKAIRRLATYFMALAWEHGAAGPKGDSVLEADRVHFMHVMKECVEWTEWEAAHGLAAATEDYLDRQGYLADRITANEIGLIASWQLGRPSEGAWLGNLGDTYRTMGHAKWAIEHFEKALATARASGDRRSEGNSLGNLGLAYRDLGQIEQAKTYLKQAHSIFEDIRSPSAGLVHDWLMELEEMEDE
ncbi:MAG: hypothetical protein D6768_14345 [Chloroflexi bacterium]|nr:MAG: hypothetical protein D6768_14345 [Chloroflexota bacterium]